MDLMTKRSDLRDTLAGFSDDHDRLWLITTPELSGAITEYNEELTGFDPHGSASSIRRSFVTVVTLTTFLRSTLRREGGRCQRWKTGAEAVCLGWVLSILG